MKDVLNTRIEFLSKRIGLNKKAHCLHKSTPPGLNNILWKSLSCSEDYYISSAGVKYLKRYDLIIPRPIKP